MKFAAATVAIYIVATVETWHRPKMVADGWGPPRTEAVRRADGGPPREEPSPSGFEHHHHHSYHHRDRHQHGYRGGVALYGREGGLYFLQQQPFPQRRRGDDSGEFLSRRTIDVRPEGGPQALGGRDDKRPDPGKTSGGRKKTARPNNRNVTDAVVFPDSPLFRPRSTSCGEGTTFCEEADADYPKEYIRRVLEREGGRFLEVFGLDAIPEANISERMNRDETGLCASSQRIIFPTKAKSKDDKWLFVVNQDGYTQGIGVETCINAEAPCSMTDGFPQGYRTYCKQKYITRRLLSLNENGGPGMNEFLFPSCCVCILQSVGLATRSKTRS